MFPKSAPIGSLAAVLLLTLSISCQTLPISKLRLSESTPATIDGITYAAVRGVIYIPIGEAIEYLELCIEPKDTLRTLVDGTKLISLTELEDEGVTVKRGEDSTRALLTKKRSTLIVQVTSKRAEVSLGEQRLRAWQGKRLVLDCRVSSGRNGRTPSGKFRAGPYKARRHYSSLYNNAPMPWSVQVTGHVFIHGFSSVPNYPASHGCIRMPLDEGNPARFFYEWVDKGTPITITKG
jgi:hypothetical protein